MSPCLRGERLQIDLADLIHRLAQKARGDVGEGLRHVGHEQLQTAAPIPLGRAGTPDDIAQVAVAILSERFGRYVVGTTVEVDGGLGLASWIPAKA